MGDTKILIKIQSVELNVREQTGRYLSAGYREVWTTGEKKKWFDSGLRQDIFFFTKLCKPALWLNQPPIERLQGHLPRG